MNKLTPQGIEYSTNDTFVFNVSPINQETFADGSALKLIISNSETSEPIIEKTFSLNADNTFNITLTEDETDKLSIGRYVYKIIIIDESGVISTQKSGFLDVIWGA